MAVLRTEAVVLHVFDYLESSRILRLLTRQAGVRSVLARGARRSSRRFGSALDLFAQGTAELHVKPARELDTLSGFDVTRARSALATDLARFAGAAVIAELALRFGGGEADPAVFDAVVDALDALAAAACDDARATALGGAWRIVATLGLAPNVTTCSHCQASLPADEPAVFSHPVGGTLCTACARLAPAGRMLPGDARVALGAWIAGESAPGDAARGTAGRAHQRLLREFLHEHLADGRPLQAFEAWERESWVDTATAGASA